MTERNYWTSTLKGGDNYSSPLVGSGALHKAITASGGIYANDGRNAIGLVKSLQNSGEHVTFGWLGEMKYFANAAVTPGQELAVGTSGYLKPATYGDWVVGRNLEESVVAGGSGRGLFDFSNPRVYQDSFGDAGNFVAFDAAADLSAAATLGKAVKTNSGAVDVGCGGANGVLIKGTTSGGTSYAKFAGQANVRAGGVIAEGTSLKVLNTGMFAAADSGDTAMVRALAASAAGNSGGMVVAQLGFASPSFLAVESDGITG